MERSYGELMENVVFTRKGLLAEGFEGKHIALIGTSSVEWMESYLGIITGCTTAVPLDAALPCEDLIDLLNRSDSVALFLSPKLRPYLDAFLGNCPKLLNNRGADIGRVPAISRFCLSGCRGYCDHYLHFRNNRKEQGCYADTE